MAIVGFSFNKIHVEKKGASKGKINISNNVKMKSVEKAELSFKPEKQEGISFRFEFNSVYEPEAGSIELEGELIYLAKKEDAKAILDEWKKSKKVKKEVMSTILNTILSKCNIQALLLSREINLPPPVPLPKVNAKK